MMAITSACPSCGAVAERETYDIGSGPELACANCEWCWGAEGQDLQPLDIESTLGGWTRGRELSWVFDRYDRNGRSISIEEHGRLLMSEEYKRVGMTTIGPYTVSTVWVGVDYSWGRDALPVIFETVVFASSGCLHGDCRRWHTEAEAEAGHEEMVTLIRATVLDPEDALADQPEKPDK